MLNLLASTCQTSSSCVSLFQLVFSWKICINIIIHACCVTMLIKQFFRLTLPVRLSDFLLQFVPDVTLCEEAVYQPLSSLRLSSVPLERLLENLPGRKVDRKSLERLRKACSPQQQVLQLLRLWREQNKDQDKLYGIIQGTTTLCTFKF